FDGGDYSVLVDAPPDVTEAMRITTVPVAGHGEVRVATFDLGHIAGGAAAPLDRLGKIAEVICAHAGAPHLVALVGVADQATADRIAEVVNEASDRCADSPAYVAYVSADRGDSRVGVLLKTAEEAAPGVA